MVHPLYQLPAVEPEESSRVTFSDQRYDLQCITRPPLARSLARCPEVWTSATKADNPENFTLPYFQCAERQSESRRRSSSGRATFIGRCIACLRKMISIFRRWRGRAEKNWSSARSSINTDDIVELSYISCSRQCDEIKARPRF